ncbi:MAG: insulinase family protein [Candidatus Marinimicrobia bacterium]|nr:insulinase family protein [Candidatus Neomarinimicrobiota bacterium]
MKKRFSIVVLLIFIFTFALGKSDISKYEDLIKKIDIPYKKYVLNNGLTLIVHEDHKAPIVAVNIWYHVGSKNEKRGKTGFAHLFEHLMFNGSEHYNDEYFKPFEKVGATDMNGTTNNDRTNYFENVPVNAIDLALWMESDRMGHLLGAIDQAKLDEQRGVVINEKKQYENQPYGKAWRIIAEHTYPSEHPYSWPVIGYEEDLKSATLEDVREWFKTYYGPANATLVIAGDVNPEEIKEKVEKYFGSFHSGPPIEKFDRWIPVLRGEHRFVMQDRVPQPRLYRVYNIPEYGSKEGTEFELIADILASGKTSRLYKRLVYDEQLATNVSVFADLKEIAGQLIIVVDLRNDADMGEVERILNEEIDKFLTKGPTDDELDRVKIGYFSDFIRGIERIGGFGGKSDILARNQVFIGDPSHYKRQLQWVAKVTKKDILSTARKWMGPGYFVLEVHPFPNYTSTLGDVDRAKLPEVGSPPEPEFPDFVKFEMNNRLEVYLVERKSIPAVNAMLIINAGYSSDQLSKPGVANFAMDMLNEGTRKYTSLELNDELERIGASIVTGANLDYSYVNLTSLNTTLDKAFELFSEVVLNPSFPSDEIERVRKRIIANIQQEMARPVYMALRVLPRFIYGKDHPYGNPMTGSGTIESINSITREDLVNYYKVWFKPNNSKLIVVGDITRSDLRAILDKYFSKWKPGGVPEIKISKVTFPEKSVVYIMDKPQSPQSVIIAGHIAPLKNDPDNLAIEAMNRILGGTFTSRINMNLREEKHWSYGARSLVLDARGQPPFIVYAPVQIDKTADAMNEILGELNGILTEEPITEEEFDKTVKNMVLSLPGRWETNRSILSSLAEIVIYDLPSDYYKKYPDEVKSLDISKLQKAAKKTIHPDKLIWVVVGDKEKIMGSIKKAGFTEIHLIDTEGNLIE